MRRATYRFSLDEALLVLVGAASAAAACALAIHAAPAEPVTWAATSVALGLALAVASFVWFARAAERRLMSVRDDRDHALQELVAAIPDGLLLLEDGRVLSVNDGLCELLGFERDELVGVEPSVFWPPEHRHEIEAWLGRLAADGEHAAELVLRRRDAGRIAVLVAGKAVGDSRRFVVTVRDVATIRARERRLAEVSSRDPETSLLDERALDERLRDVVRRSLADGTEASLVMADVGVDGNGHRPGSLASPRGLQVVDRLQRLVRGGDELAQTSDGELVWILPCTSRDGAVEAVARARAAISGLGATLTAGACDLGTAGDAPSLYALADQALVDARRQGAGSTASSSSPEPVELGERATT